jgi:carboxyl-terminal processing protease
MLALGGALVTGGWLLERGLQNGNTAYARARLFDDVIGRIARSYVDSLPEAELYTKAAAGLLQELNDPYSTYLPPDRLKRLNESTTGNYAGLGVRIDVRDGWITIIAPLPGTPAERAGIQPGDRIVGVDGRSTEGWTVEEARAALRGPKGSRVSLQVERPGVEEPLSFTLVRSAIHVRSVSHQTMLTDRVGYADLTIFSDSSGDELRGTIADLRRRGMKTLVLDLRSNPGGLLEQGVAIADLFLDKGQTIVSMRGRTAGTTHVFTDDADELWPDLNVITLVDGHSASAAEIVAGALQDHDRAVILGSTTYGKGSAQSVYPLGDDAGAVKLTTARWYTPSGRSIQRAHRDTTAEGDAHAEDITDSTGEPPLQRRKAYRTDSGRVVYGGGGITPDLIIANDDSASNVLAFWRLLGRDASRFRDALTSYALELKGAGHVTSPTFSITPQMRADLWRRMRARGISLDQASYEEAAGAVDRLLGAAITRYVFGPDAEFRRRVRDDRVITVALELADSAHTQRELLARAAKLRADKREDVASAP